MSDTTIAIMGGLVGMIAYFTAHEHAHGNKLKFVLIWLAVTAVGTVAIQLLRGFLAAA